MWQAFTYAALWRNRDGLPGLLQLLPESARAEVSRVAGEAGALSPDDLAARIIELRNRDLSQAESVIGPAQSCPRSILELKYRQHVGVKP